MLIVGVSLLLEIAKFVLRVSSLQPATCYYNGSCVLLLLSYHAYRSMMKTTGVLIWKEPILAKELAWVVVKIMVPNWVP